MFTKDMLEGYVRHTMTFFGGYLVLKGYTDEATVMLMAGLAATAVGVFWSWYYKKPPVV